MAKRRNGEMNIKRINKTSLILMLIIAVMSSALAMVIQTRIITNTGTIKFVGDFNVFSDSSCGTPLTAINWEQMNKGGTYSKIYYIKNTGSMGADTIYVFWNVSELPTGFTLTMEWDGSPWSVNTKKPLAPDVIKPIKFLIVLKSDVPAGAFSYTQTFTGVDTP